MQIQNRLPELQCVCFVICIPSNRDVEAEEKQETPWAQQEQFEAEQIKKAASKFGAKDRKSKAGKLSFGAELAFSAELWLRRSR